MSHSYIISNRLNKFPSKVETIVRVLFVLLSVQYVVSHYAAVGVIPNFSLFLFQSLTILNLALALLYLRVRWSSYRLVFILYVLFILFNSLIQNQGNLGEVLSQFLIYSQVLTALYLSTIDTSFFLGIFRNIALLGIIGFSYIISIHGVDTDIALQNRGYTFHEMFYYASLFWAVIPAVILFILHKKNLLIVLSYWILAIIINLIFLKRFILVDSILLLLVVLFINHNNNNKLISGFKLSFWMASLVGLSLYYASEIIITLLEATNERFESSADDLAGFDRFVEYRNYFEKEATIIDLLIGKGIASFHKGLGVEAYSLHTGWANFIFKGGVIWFVLILAPFFKMISLIGKFKNLPVDIQFSVSLLLINVPRFFYTNMDNFQPVMLVFFYALFKVADYKHSKSTLPVV
jgi:hypothetical protein